MILAQDLFAYLKVVENFCFLAFLHILQAQRAYFRASSHYFVFLYGRRLTFKKNSWIQILLLSDYQYSMGMTPS